MRKCLCLLLFFIVFVGIVLVPRTAPAATKATHVYFASVNGVIGVAMEEHVRQIFAKVGEDKNALLIVTLNTPGGLVDSMSEIVSAITRAPFPVVVWVAPSGARSASAGAFLVEAAHVAVMAPGTHIGAAHPVTAGGKDVDDKEMNRKIVNDLTARMRALAQERSRDEKVLASMVTSSVSLTAREALQKGVIDFLAVDEDELFRKLEGRKVVLRGETRTLSLKNTEIQRIDISLRLRILEFLSRPDIAYLAFIAGVMAIILEARAPGGFVLGTIGAVLLMVAAYGMRVLPVNWAGVLLLLAGIGIMVADFLVGGLGILIVIGLATMLFGGLILFQAPGGELLHQSVGLISGTTIAMAIVFFVIMRAIYKTLRMPSASGSEGMLGIKGRVIKNADLVMVQVHGEYWNAVNVTGEPLQIGQEVTVVAVDGLMLTVKIRTDKEHFAHNKAEESQKEE